jgi:hypothetical protein
MTQDEVSVPVPGERDALDLLIPHLELLPEHLPYIRDGDVLNPRVFDRCHDLLGVVDLSAGLEDPVDGARDAFVLELFLLLDRHQLLQVLWVLPHAPDYGADCADLDLVIQTPRPWERPF